MSNAMEAVTGKTSCGHMGDTHSVDVPIQFDVKCLICCITEYVDTDDGKRL